MKRRKSLLGGGVGAGALMTLKDAWVMKRYRWLRAKGGGGAECGGL